MSTNDGGPFHPCEVRLTDSGELLGVQTGNSRGIHTGASLRDHFAGLAMQGLIAGGNYQHVAPEQKAIVAYEYADAMLRARENGNG